MNTKVIMVKGGGKDFALIKEVFLNGESFLSFQYISSKKLSLNYNTINSDWLETYPFKLQEQNCNIYRQ